MRIIKISFCLAFIVILYPLFAEKDISIITNPAGAGVYFNGSKLGVTPFIFSRETSDLPLFNNPGISYDFILYKDFFEGEIISVTYDPGKKNQFTANLHYLTRLPLYDGIFQVGYILNFYKLLMDTSSQELAALRNEIYAKYGGKLNSEFKETIGEKAWYKENPYFSEDFFSSTDAANLEMIKKIEFETEEDESLTKKIIDISTYSDSEKTISFSDDGYMEIYPMSNGSEYDSEYGSEYDSAYYMVTPDSLYGDYSWRVVDGAVYLWNMDKEKLFYVILDHENTEIEQFEDISYEYWMPYGDY